MIFTYFTCPLTGFLRKPLLLGSYFIYRLIEACFHSGMGRPCAERIYFSTPTAFTCLMKVAKPKVKGSIEKGNIASSHRKLLKTFTMNNHNIPASAWKANAEVLKWFLVCCVACTCVGVMYLQWTYIWMLRAEMAEITQRVRPQDTAGNHGGKCCDAACYGVSCDHRFPEKQTLGSVRDKRDVSEQMKQRKKRQNDQDTTVLSWAVGQSRGEGLQVSGDTITVETEGPYFIYSQVLYKDTTWVMGHVITKKHKGAETKLMKCLKSMPNNISQPLNTCYTAGIYFLESGSTLQLSVPRKSAEVILTAHATFMGLFSM